MALPPDELTLVLHLPAAGTVAIRDVKLYQYAGDEDPLASVRLEFNLPNRQVRSAMNIFIVLLFVAALVVLIVSKRGKRSAR